MLSTKILSSAIAGTSAMTLFSYLVSESKNKNFREPEILSQLIKRLPIQNSKTSADISGWCAHYTVGIIFVALYHELWKETKIKPSITSGITLGALSGLVGIGTWQGIFGMHPNPPSKNLKKYFKHLMIAHMVFGAFSAISYKLTGIDKRKNEND
ncbi:MAG: hypothetical protein ABIT08_06975 [Bacteroidia bacterium]